MPALNRPHLHKNLVNSRTSIQLAVKDIVDGLLSVHVWAVLGWQEVRQRYRRSILGPFWITISTALMVVVMGPLYGKLFGQDIGRYFAHLGISYVFWLFLAQTINDSCTAFISSEGYIKQVKLPLTVYVASVIWKNVVFLAHNFVVIVLVMGYVRPQIGISILLVPVALVVMAVNGIMFGVVLAALSARFRDIPMIVLNLVQVAFFMTPVMWQAQMLGRHQWAVNLNPFYHFLEIARAPLLGLPTNAWSWVAVAALTLVGGVACMVTMTRCRSRIAYWV